MLFITIDFKAIDNDIPCNISGGKQIPKTWRCVYDIDSSGFAMGCTDGSHYSNVLCVETVLYNIARSQIRNC